MNRSLLLGIRSLSKTYRVGLAGCTASARALDDVHLDVARGEIVAVVGPRNAGKTTLLRCAAGLLAPDSGAIDRAAIADAPEVVIRYLQDPIELALLLRSCEIWQFALVDNVDVVRGDVGGAFALLAAARRARAAGGAMLLAARETRAVANVADRVVLLDHGRLCHDATFTPMATATHVAERSVRL